MYLLTRPLPKMDASARAFAEQGLSVCSIALSDITALDSACNALIEQLQSATAPDIVVVTSVFSATLWCQLLTQQPVLAKRLDSSVFVAVGASSARVLRTLHSRVLVPQPETSEGLLALPVLKDAKNRHVFIIKGQGGRTLLRESLVQQGNQVSVFDLYQRVPLTPPVTSCALTINTVQGVIVTSEEQALQLLHYPEYRGLCDRPWLTVSERIASLLTQHGVARTSVCKSASDDALIRWIKDNWE